MSITLEQIHDIIYVTNKELIERRKEPITNYCVYFNKGVNGNDQFLMDVGHYRHISFTIDEPSVKWLTDKIRDWLGLPAYIDEGKEVKQ